MADLLLGLGGLTLSGSLVIWCLALISRSNRSQFGARWRCLAWLLLCLRLAVLLSFFPLNQMGREQPLVQLPAPSDTVIYQHRPGPAPQLPASSEGADGAGQPSVGQPLPLPPVEQLKPAAPAQSAEEDAGFSLSLSQAAVLAWLGGAAIFVLWMLTAHLAENAGPVGQRRPYMVQLVERDPELACDEGALRQLPQEEHTAYGRTILDAVERLKG